jgi:hypothetical protein
MLFCCMLILLLVWAVAKRGIFQGCRRSHESHRVFNTWILGATALHRTSTRGLSPWNILAPPTFTYPVFLMAIWEPFSIGPLSLLISSDNQGPPYPHGLWVQVSMGVGRGLHFPTCTLQNEPLYGSNSNEMGKAISDLTKTLITCPFRADFCVLGLHFDRKPCRCGCSVACSDLQVTCVDHYESFQLFFISASRQLACGLSHRQPIKKR